MGLSLDIGFILICVFFSVRAFFRGFLSEFLSLLAFVFGAWISKISSPLVLSSLPDSLSGTVYVPMVVYGIIFLLGYIAIKILDKQLSKIINLIMLAGLNKILGIIFGVIEGMTIILIVVYILRHQSIVDFNFDEYLSKSSVLTFTEGLWENIKLILGKG